MNPLHDWKPRRPSPALRDSIFSPLPPRRPHALWPSVGLVIALCWSGSLLVWIHGDGGGLAVDRPALAVSTVLGLVAQNSVPVTAASFAFTNSALPPSTNASFSGTNSSRN